MSQWAIHRFCKGHLAALCTARILPLPCRWLEDRPESEVEAVGSVVVAPTDVGEDVMVAQ